jgi:hypothetical protein
MIEWFDDLTLGMRFKSGEVSVSNEDIKRFAAEFDPQLGDAEVCRVWMAERFKAPILKF